MTFLEAIYGSQYYEISSKGGDGSKGRLNGNLLLTAFIILALMTFLALLAQFSSVLNGVEQKFATVKLSGRTIGKVGGVILFGLLYVLITRTVGSRARYEVFTAAFMTYPAEVKKKANAKFFIPFFILLAILMACIIF